MFETVDQDNQPAAPAVESSASPAQISANKKNALRSSGPSPAGLANSCQNHTIHGLARHQNGAFKLLTSENSEIFESFKQSLFDEHQPTTPTELILVNGMAESHWLAERAQRLQDTCIDPNSGAITDEKKASLYLRYQTTHTRAFHKSLHDLLKLRAENRRAQIGFEAQNVKNEQHAMKKALHECEVQMKDTAVLHEICKYTTQLIIAKRQDPAFAAEFAAELKRRGIPMGEREEILTSAA